MYSHLIQLLNVTLISGAISLSSLSVAGDRVALVISPGLDGGSFSL